MRAVVTTYGHVNLVILVSYVIFAGTSPLFAKVRLASRLRWGQLVLLVAIFGSLGLGLLPRKTLPQVSASVLAPLTELTENFRSYLPARREVLASETAKPLRETTAGARTYLSEIALAVLGLGILSAIASKLVSALRLLRLLRESTELKRIGRVRIIVSPAISVPFSTLVGGQAWVAVPELLLSQWDDFKLAVRHELQHHRQKDTLWALLIEGIVAVFFLNPFIHLWKRKLLELQELACDNALISRKVSTFDYGCCLVRVAEAALEHRQRWVGTTSMAAGSENPSHFKSFLRRRIEMLSHHSTRHSHPATAALFGTVVLCLTSIAAYGAGQVLGAKATDPVSAGLLKTDPAIQKIAEVALAAALNRHGASLGFVIVGDPVTGRVLAVANQEIPEKETTRTPHWALALRIGPASIVKAILAAASVEKGVTTFSEMHNCEKGKFTLGGRLYQDWMAFDKLSTADTVIQSSNNCAIKIGQKLGAFGLSTALKDFGFGAGGTAEGFPEARTGEVPVAKNAEDTFFIADIASGNGSLWVTPLEVIQAFGAIANGGNLLKPQSADGEVSPMILRRVLSKKNADDTKEVLAQVMVRGTAMKAASKLYRLGGKTATGYSDIHAKVVKNDLIPNFAGFAGLGPIENPRVVIYVGVENPTDVKGVHGSYHAAPLFTEVAEKTLQYLKVPPTN